ncbi:MAG TPA: NAD(P)H-dependent oxidoreductase subunit E [Clostridiales bacterium]|jgi:NADP-reducing hydrogenase subunit HndA|nr:NAD(P)H-dependent oxidoreductase subunit E [Clostridiales bacterium]
MKKQPTTVPFRGTAEQEQQLLSVIEKYRGTKGAMMPILQEAQGIYGYLPIEVLKIIAEKTDTPMEAIYGIVSFYSQFKLNYDGDITISICMGTACYVKGSADVLNEVASELGVEPGATSSDGRYSLDATRCIGACGLAPVMIINGTVYGRVKKEEVAGILAKYKE